jgi:hypothetical protein
MLGLHQGGLAFLRLRTVITLIRHVTVSCENVNLKVRFEDNPVLQIHKKGFSWLEKSQEMVKHNFRDL